MDISGVQLIAKILGNLSAHFDLVRPACDNLDQNKQTLASLTSRLLREETRIALRDEAEEPSATFHAMNGNRHAPRKKFIYIM